MCPSRGEISRVDVANLGQQSFAHRDRLLGIEGDRDFALAAATAMSIAGRSRRHPRLAIFRLERAVNRRWQQRGWPITEIRRIKIVLTGDADQREQGVAASIGQRRPHALGIGRFGDGTDRPVRRDPLARRMGERGGQMDHAGGLIDGGRLQGGDLVLAERLTHDVEAARERRIAEAALAFPGPAGADGCRERLFRIDEFGLGLGQG